MGEGYTEVGMGSSETDKPLLWVSLVDRKQLASFGVCIPATTVPGLGGRGGHRGEGGGGHACPYGHVYPKDTQGTQ